MLPIGTYGQTVLVGGTADKRVAVFIEGSTAFRFFKYETNDNFDGLIVPGIELELDETSVFHDSYVDAPLGTLVRQGAELCIVAYGEHTFGRGMRVPLVANLPSLQERRSAGFTRWQLTVGQGPTSASFEPLM